MVAHQVPLSMGISQARILEWVAIPFSRDLLALGIKPRSPALQADSLLSKPPGKPIIQKTWVQFSRSGRSPGEGNGSPLQYSGLENSRDRGAWQAIYSSWGFKELDMTE